MQTAHEQDGVYIEKLQKENALLERRHKKAEQIVQIKHDEVVRLEKENRTHLTELSLLREETQTQKQTLEQRVSELAEAKATI